MRCDQARERIGLLLDGELSGADSRALMAHTEDCPGCARFRDELKDLRCRLVLARERAPRGLVQRVRAGLAVAAGAPDDEPAPSSGATRQAVGLARAARQWPAAFRYAAVIVIACVMSAAATWWWAQGTNAHDALAHDVLSAHIRSLLQENTVQVASLETHVVKPWFAGRLEFTPVVKDLAADGFQLIGGRLDYVGGRRVAVIVYRRRLHQVNVFVWPTGSDVARPAYAKLNGYNLLSWSRGGMTFWAVSDLNEGELRELQSLL